MWVSPNHPNPPRPANAPTEEGERIACFDRAKGEQLRVTLETFNGFPFVRLTVWAPGADGQHWPVKGRTTTLKMREVGPLAEALSRIAEPAGSPSPRSSTPEAVPDRGPRRRRDWRDVGLTKPPAGEDGDQPFNEFDSEG